VTNISSDRSQRRTATPYQSTPWTDFRGGKISYPEHLTSTTALTVALRMTTPAFAKVVEAHLTMQMNIGSSLSVKLAIGSFDIDSVTPLTPAQAEIDRQNLLITGSSSGIASSGSVLLLDGIDLLPFLPKRGDASFSEVGFVLIMQFSRLRTTSDTVRRFDMQMSADLGIV
jgi:hypothetical protein